MNRPTGSDRESESELDRIFSLLASRTRRQLLQYLDCHQRPVSVRKLAAELSETLPSPRSTEVELYHRHLPALEAAGLIEWNREDETVSCASGNDRTFEQTELVAGEITVTVTGRTGTDIERRVHGETKR
jgi:DNA-binding transcriptional ArsR family regulator